MTSVTSFMMTPFMSWNHAATRLPVAPLKVMEMPSSSEKTMIGSMRASAMAATGLLGIMSMITWVSGVTSAISCWTAATGVAPTPG